MRKIHHIVALCSSQGRAIQRFCWPLWVWLACVSLLFSACAPDTNLLGAGNWQAFSLTRQHIHALAVDPVHAQILYAGDVDGTVYKSSDAGQHWTKQTPISTIPTTLTGLFIAPSGRTLYTLATDGLFASSDDDALTWQRLNTVASGLPVDSYTSLAFGEQKQVYLGTLHHGIFASSDGMRWQSINATLPSTITINELAYDHLQHSLWAATSQGVYRSANKGVDWQPLNNGLNIVDGVVTVQPAANAGGPPALVYAGTKYGIFRSTDSGLHWSMAGQLLQGIAIESILVDFRSTDAATVYVGTPFGAFRSDDSGQNWRGIAGGLPEHTPVYALVIGANNASQLFAAVNNVYAFPGTGSSVTPTRVITLLLIVLLFLMLLLIARRSTRRRKTLFKRTSDTPEHAESA